MHQDTRLSSQNSLGGCDPVVGATMDGITHEIIDACIKHECK